MKQKWFEGPRWVELSIGGKMWVSFTLRLMPVMLVLAAVLLSTSSSAQGKELLTVMQQCNAGIEEANYEILLSDHSSNFVPAFINVICIKTLLKKYPNESLNLAYMTGFSSEILPYLPPEKMPPFLVGIISRGDRFQLLKKLDFSNYLTSTEYFTKNLDQKTFDTFVAFFTSETDKDFEDKKYPLPDEVIMSFESDSPELQEKFVRYCSNVKCNFPSHEEICSFSKPFEIKYLFYKDPLSLSASLKGCDTPDIVQVAALRSIGLLDGQCSLTFQTQLFLEFGLNNDSNCFSKIMKLNQFNFLNIVDAAVYIRRKYENEILPFKIRVTEEDQTNFLKTFDPDVSQFFTEQKH